MTKKQGKKSHFMCVWGYLIKIEDIELMIILKSLPTISS